MKRERIILVIMVALMIIAGFLAHPLLDLASKEKELMEAVKKQSKKVEMLKRDYDILALEAELKEIQEKINTKSPFPQRNPQIELVILIDRAALGTGVKVITLRCVEAKEYKLEKLTYQSHRNTIKIEGELGSLLSFIKMLEEAPFPILLENLAFKPTKIGWEADFDIILLFLKG